MQKASLEFVAINDLHGLGVTEGPPSSYFWLPPSPLPSLMPWLALLLLLALPANRTRKALWIVLPLALLAFGCTKLHLLSDFLFDRQIELAFKGLVFGAAAVWLLMPYLRNRFRAISFVLMYCTWALVAGGTYLLSRTYFGTRDLLPFVILLSILAFLNVLSLAIAGLLCRRQYRPVRLSIGSAALILIITVVAALSIEVGMEGWNGLQRLLEPAGIAAGVASVCYTLLFSFLLLSFLNSHFKRGLKALLHMEDAQSQAPSEPLVPATGAAEKSPLERTSV